MDNKDRMPRAISAGTIPTQVLTATLGTRETSRNCKEEEKNKAQTKGIRGSIATPMLRIQLYRVNPGGVELPENLAIKKAGKEITISRSFTP